MTEAQIYIIPAISTLYNVASITGAYYCPDA